VDRKIRQNSKPLGFTMVELVILLAIVAILSGLVISEIMSYIEKAHLRQAINQFLSDLNYVKNQAQITGVAWGIRACTGTGKYKIFIDHDGNCTDSTGNCNISNDTKICINHPDRICNNDNDCPGGFVGTCRPLEYVREFSPPIKFVNNFTIVFDRKGFAFGENCKFGAKSTVLQSSSGYSFKISITRFGRIRVE
jgi:type II secretory pathway pseudopilin PulG